MTQSYPSSYLLWIGLRVLSILYFFYNGLYVLIRPKKPLDQLFKKNNYVYINLLVGNFMTFKLEENTTLGEVGEGDDPPF